MADALDAVLNLVAQNNQRQQWQADNLNQSVQLFNQARQQTAQNQLDQLRIRSGLAQSALQLNPDGSISYNGALMNPYQQTMAKLNALSAAKQTGLPDVFNSVLNAVNGATPNTAPNTTPQTYPALTSQVNNLLAAGQPSPNVAPSAGAPNVNQMLTLGQTSTTDPVTSVTSTSQNQVSLPAQAMQSTQAAQIPNQVAANKAAAEAQTQAASGAEDYKNIYGLAQNIDKAGYLGNPVNTTLYKIAPTLTPPDVQSNISELQAAIKRSSQSSQIADTATYGEGVAKRMSAGQESIGPDSTLGQIKGWVKGNITSDYYKEIGTQQFAQELAKQGLNPNQVTPDQFGAGVMKYWGKLNPSQNKELQTRIMTTLAPSNAAGFSVKTGKYYDGQMSQATLPNDYVSLTETAPDNTTTSTPQLPDDYVPLTPSPTDQSAGVQSMPVAPNPTFLPNYNAVMAKIGTRPSMISSLIQDPSTLDRFQQHPLGTTLRTIGGAMQYAEGVPAAIGLAAQSGNYSQLPDMLGKLMQGQASPQLGDLIRTTGFGGAANEPLAATTGLLATLAPTPAAKMVQPASNALAYNVMKDYLQPTAKNFAYAHDPVRGILNEGLTFNNVDDAAKQAQASVGSIGQQIKTAIQNSSVAGTISDISSVLQPIDDQIAELSKSPASNSTAIARLMATKLDLANVYSPQGQLIGPKDFNMTPAQAFDLKQQVSQLTKWTGNLADDKPVNTALQDVYSNIKNHLNDQVDGLADLNQRYGDMTEASKRLNTYATGNHNLSNTMELGKEGVLSTVFGHFTNPVAGATFQALQMAARTGAVKSRLANLLYSAPKS